jgi:hypothetical protein
LLKAEAIREAKDEVSGERERASGLLREGGGGVVSAVGVCRVGGCSLSASVSRCATFIFHLVFTRKGMWTYNPHCGGRHAVSVDAGRARRDHACVSSARHEAGRDVRDGGACLMVR